MDEEAVDEAARRTAINLMRLNETLELADALHYSEIPRDDQSSPRRQRQAQLGRYYRDWFRRRATEE